MTDQLVIQLRDVPPEYPGILIASSVDGVKFEGNCIAESTGYGIRVGGSRWHRLLICLRLRKPAVCWIEGCTFIRNSPHD